MVASQLVTAATTNSIDTTIGAGDPAGANVTFDGSVTGGGDLSIDAGTGGLVVFNGADAAGRVTLGTLTLTNAIPLRLLAT